MAVRRIFGTLRSRIFAALFAISLVPIGVLGAQGYHCAMQAVYELAHKHVLAVADGRSTAVVNWIEERTKSVETMAGHLATARILPELSAGTEGVGDAQQRSLDSFLRVNPAFGEVMLLDVAGRPVAGSSPQGHRHHALNDGALLAVAEASSGAVYGVAHGHDTGDVGLHMVSAIKDMEKGTVGFFAAYLDMTKRLTPLLQDRQGLYKTGKVYIVSSENDILTEPLPGDGAALSKWKTATAKAAHAHGMPDGVETYLDYRGKLVLGTAVPIGFEGWLLVTEIERDEALVWLNVLLERTLVTGIVTCVVVVAIAFWVSSLVGRPLRQLMCVSHRIRGGHVGERLDEMDVAEAEGVRKAFNSMLDELREKQEELVRTTTLAYVGELTSSTVHEMRNPLSSIKMNLQALSRSTEADSSNNELGEIALQQSIRLERMLTDLLGFGKPVHLEPVSLSFSELTDAVKDVMGSTAIHNDVGLTFEDRLEDRLLCVDKEQMCRALTGLIANTLEAMPQGGDIVLMGSVCPQNPSGVLMTVQDTGPGLSQEALQRSFQPFYTTKKDGTGLGLPNVKKIVELHGGTITVANRPEVGAEFSIRLPGRCVKET